MPFNTRACLHSPRFAVGHRLNMHFVRAYKLNEELGSVAVKFIIKDKVPEHAWMEDEALGRLPTEVMLLSFIDHENIVKCLDLFEDDLYFYLVQELHGTPWESAEEDGLDASSSPSSLGASTPALSPSVSVGSMADSVPGTPLCSLSHSAEHPGSEKTFGDTSSALAIPGLLDPASIRPSFARRPSHDLFECIEQSEHKRLPEDQARYVFAQVVDAVHYLDSLGVTHRDIKDENLVIDKHLKVKLIDFGSAVVVDPTKPRPYHTLFYGTTAYASSEILLKKKYQAPPAEIWTLGVLLSYLLTGSSPFPTVKDAIDGRIALPESAVARFSKEAMEVMHRCLDPNPLTRATIAEVRSHQWLTGARTTL
ncbi:kinase-like protein [Infundibulicybe gibba]|nr:kinase-like protein [Infundibulicybe gibba]